MSTWLNRGASGGLAGARKNQTSFTPIASNTKFLTPPLSARPTDTEQGSPTREMDYVAELREQAAEVKAELAAATKDRRSLARNTLGILSLGVFAYGFATETMDKTTGMFQLLTTLGLLHQLGTPDAQHVAQLKSKPGYLLVAAQEFLAHARPEAAAP